MRFILSVVLVVSICVEASNRTHSSTSSVTAHHGCCDKHNGQWSHVACKLYNAPCCHHGRDCCGGAIAPYNPNCQTDVYPVLADFPQPPMPNTSAPMKAAALVSARIVRNGNDTNSSCCMWKDWAGAFYGNVTETIACIPNITCPLMSSGAWCSHHEWNTSCAMGWATGCACQNQPRATTATTTDTQGSANLEKPQESGAAIDLSNNQIRTKLELLLLPLKSPG